MSRLITLSRAARLVGVKRGVLQKRIQQGELRTFEGELLLSDLLHAYPQTEIEDTTMLERVETIMENAVNKIIRPDDESPDTDTLAARILSLGQELAQARAEARRNSDIIESLKHRFEEISSADEQTQQQAFSTLRDWFYQTLDSLDTTEDDSGLVATEAFLRVMAAQVRILPSGHEFFIEGSDSILEAGLHSGLALNYGCSNGNCGLCKCKVISGQVKQIAPHDYSLTEAEKGLGYILTCANTAVTDVVLEADEAHGAWDIPSQDIETRIRKIEQIDDRVLFLQARTPRTRRLRFLAGQYLSVHIDGLPAQDCAIASCPCDDMNLQFHIPVIAGDSFSEQLGDCLRPNASMVIKGPAGDFILNEDSPRSLVFIACDVGFAPIKSLIEHALALDIAEDIHLYWITTPGNHHYLGNLCRSWDDALDNFHYTALEATADTSVADLLPTITDSLSEPQSLDYYACMPASLLAQMESFLVDYGIPAQQVKTEPVRETST